MKEFFFSAVIKGAYQGSFVDIGHQHGVINCEDETTASEVLENVTNEIAKGLDIPANMVHINTFNKV